MTIEVPVGPWAPDMPDYENEGSTEALNVVPAAKSYRPFPSFSALSQSLAARAQGAIFVRKADGSGIVIAGDRTKLYLMTATSIADISRISGGPYACPSTGCWSFAQFGSNVLAFNGSDAGQTFDIETDGHFVDLGGSPPTSLYACVAGDFVMTGNQRSRRTRVQWSAINDSADWAVSQATQASYQDLPDGGWIKGVVGIEYAAIIFQEFAIRRASYEGPPLVFRFDRLSNGLGCSLPGSIASYRNMIFFCDRSGFYMIPDGIQIVPIGHQLVDTTFWGLIDQGNLHRVTAAIDPANSLYAIAFPDATATNGDPNHLYIYQWQLQRWAHVRPGDLDIIFQAVAGRGYTMEGLASAAPNLEMLGTSLDSLTWQGQASGLIGAFNTNHALGYFNGAPLAATIDTTEANIIPGKRAFLRSLRPLVDDRGGNATVALGIRDRLNEAPVFGPAVVQNARGQCRFRSGSKALYHRARIMLEAGAAWEHVQGVTDIRVQPAGTR
jgi:hypothetical protein